MRYIKIIFVFHLISLVATSQNNIVTVVKDKNGIKLDVDGKDFMINGMNWDYFPVGTNYTYNIWDQSDEIIQEALDPEMSLLRNMGVNAIRVYMGIPAKWIRYIYDNFDIYVVLNHSFGRYGIDINGTWFDNTDYSDPRVKRLLLDEVTHMVDEYKDTPGLLMYLLGNENNYGLFWEGAETEDIPIADRKSEDRARAMYKLFDEAAVAMKNIDGNHPVAICNGDLFFLDIIRIECPDIDILGTNMYRGLSFGDAFQNVKEEIDKPIMFTELGADAYDAIQRSEDQQTQAYYLVNNWKEIYENASGMGRAGNSIGGFTFQFSDGWWKFSQTSNLSVHDTDASWSSGGYSADYQKGKNNMNEEWFGICAKGETNERGLYTLYPRAAYYALKKVHLFNPYARDATSENLNKHFSRIPSREKNQ